MASKKEEKPREKLEKEENSASVVEGNSGKSQSEKNTRESRQDSPAVPENKLRKRTTKKVRSLNKRYFC